MTLPQEIEKALQGIRSSTRQLRHITTDMKNQILNQLAEELESRQLEILEANKIDLRHLAQDEAPAFRDRLTLDEKRIAGIAEGLRQVSRLTDPVNEMMSEETLKNGLILRKVRAPIGIIFMIFESRPNVILEAFSLAFKSGNAIILRGGSDSRETSSVIYKIMSDVLGQYNLDGKLFYGLQDYDRDIVRTLLKRKDLIDVVVPRGGEKLIAFVQSESLMPIIKNDRGLCHAYVDDEADLKMALSIVVNGKTQRPGVCNSLETVLVHKDVAEKFLPALHKALAAFQVRWKVDPATAKILQGEMNLELAVEQNWSTE
ncbi:MAG: glutamate-5-semialdehyde dehydrogenase, partial [Bdellovibrionota bacterium]